MFFDPLWFYLKGLVVTLIVEVGMFYLFISKKPLRLLATSLFNITSHISLHIFFHYMVVWGFGYNFYIWFIGELLVLALEGFLYWFSKLIPDVKKAYLWAFLFNIASIIVGQIINVFLF